MASLRTSTFTSQDASLRSRSHFAADAIVLVAVAVILWLLIELSHGITEPFNRVSAPSTVSTDPANLPYYAARSLLRMFAALAVSTVFTFLYATAAARLRRAEKILLPTLDILQSVPVLGFLSITLTIWLTLFPGTALGVELASIFAIFTFIQPILIELAGFSEAAVSPVLLVFGAGLVVGNLLGGRWADRSLAPALIGTLVLMTLAMFASGFAFHSQAGAVVAAFVLGAAAFATVAPLQMWVLEKASGAGQGLASSFNIAAFNLGNAIGAWLGGLVIAWGYGFAATGFVGALLSIAGAGVFAVSYILDRKEKARA